MKLGLLPALKSRPAWSEGLHRMVNDQRRLRLAAKKTAGAPKR